MVNLRLLFRSFQPEKVNLKQDLKEEDRPGILFIMPSQIW